MSAQGLEGRDRTMPVAQDWINDLDRMLEWNDKARSYRLLKAVLHALRDSLQIDEAVDLGAQLPVPLRGVYYEQWHPGTAPVRSRSIDDFLAHVNQSFQPEPLPDPAKAIMAVFHLLANKIMQGETADVKHGLPKGLREAWLDAGDTDEVRH